MVTVSLSGLATSARWSSASEPTYCCCTACWRDQTTSEESSAWPLENRSPDCSVKVYLRPSSETSHCLARPAVRELSWPRETSVSYTLPSSACSMAGLSSVRMSIEDGASGTPMVTAVSDWIELTWSMT